MKDMRPKKINYSNGSTPISRKDASTVCVQETLNEPFHITSDIFESPGISGVVSNGAFEPNCIVERVIPASVQEVSQISSSRTATACIPCWRQKLKCVAKHHGVCQHCSKTSIPVQLCIKERFTSDQVFSKWRENGYQSQLAWYNLTPVHSTTALLCHDSQGPTLRVSCCLFQPASPEQTRLYYKIGSGWDYIETTSYALDDPDLEMMRIHEYVQSCLGFFLAGTSSDSSPLRTLFEVAPPETTDPLMRMALSLWAANRALMSGWQMSGLDWLGMFLVVDECSPLYGSVPAPRVLQNQLDRQLETYIATVEAKFLKELSSAMLRNRPYLSLATP
ncbi:hypothetical protein M409DRAFT_61404 [Zasmidium cellare ATCC 36951]|uniref:Zn(2)-C6 fungal-type domain-containing protein n=1 Tax=Zasmidium cellare ATCC 36951 TaxID=1080233 RepID=A0A6A6BVM5_ZASCE|nr:uncharacterized protein M409DRAFT_61404 [Zasmidium cellare ATCC 36951]KAF2158745.1 hypothetical protein M409DRAFT_61404 [Zasmidium cellare ATCC 36951]